MRLIDWLGKWVLCPECRHKSAKVFWGKVSCPDISCKKYDPQLVIPAEMLLKSGETDKTFKGDFYPGANSLTVSYRNYLGKDRTYEIDKTSLVAKAKRDCITARVAPTGKRITFKKKFIKNWKEIEGYLSQQARIKRGPDITVKYRNFKDKDMSFVGDSSSIRLEGDRISILVKSANKRFVLRKDRIQNFSEIERYITS